MVENSRHRFCFSTEWGQELTAAAPSFSRRSGAHAKLIRDNDTIVEAGRYDTADGQHCQIPPAPPSERFEVPAASVPLDTIRFTATTVCVANIDTISAALALGDATALNFANAYRAGGGYRTGASAQEEDLCRLLPQMIHSLEACKYPIQPEETILTKDLQAVRAQGTYALCQSRGPVHILTAAMPCGDAGRPGGDTWNHTVRLRMRSVLHAAKMSGFPNLVLGAWGCGAFGNPPHLVSALFREQLESPEFRGAFEKIVFAVVDPSGDGNFKPFLKEIARIHQDADDAGTQP